MHVSTASPQVLEDETESTWSLEIGFSYLQTGGNSQTTSTGLDLDFGRQSGRWSWDLDAEAIRGSEAGEANVEHYSVKVGFGRALGRRTQLTGGVQGERDRFSGVDLRGIAGLGWGWDAVRRARFRLDSTAQLTVTREELSTGQDREQLGSLLGIESHIELSAHADLQQSLTLYPSLEDRRDYRLEAEVSLKASLTRKLAVNVGYSLRYDNRPVPGFRRRDTRATSTLVLRFG